MKILGIVSFLVLFSPVLNWLGNPLASSKPYFDIENTPRQENKKI